MTTRSISGSNPAAGPTGLPDEAGDVPAAGSPAGADVVAADGIEVAGFAGPAGTAGTLPVSGGADAAYAALGGVSFGVAAEAAVGVKALPPDPSPELYARITSLFSSLGTCVDAPF